LLLLPLLLLIPPPKAEADDVDASTVIFRFLLKGAANLGAEYQRPLGHSEKKYII
jgi:hypothetical protein